MYSKERETIYLQTLLSKQLYLWLVFTIPAMLVLLPTPWFIEPCLHHQWCWNAQLDTQCRIISFL